MRQRRTLLDKINGLFLTFTKRKVDFVIAGTQKGGTSALNAYLRTHPEIGMAHKKELHFFDQEKNFQTAPPPYGLYHRNFARGRSRKIWGEATPIYMYWEPAPARIRDYNPRMKFILLLRNPIERAYSHWNMERTLKQDKLSFWDALQAEPQRLKDALPSQSRFFSYMSRGRYTEQLERLWQHFPREQFLILKSEDLRDQPQKTLDAVCQFLDVSRLPGVEKMTVHSRPYESRITEQEKAYLKTVFAPEVKKLETMLGWDCRSWLAD